MMSWWWWLCNIRSSAVLISFNYLHCTSLVRSYAMCCAVLSHCPQTSTSNLVCIGLCCRKWAFRLRVWSVWLHVEDKLDINLCCMMVEIHTCYFQGSLFYVSDLCSFRSLAQFVPIYVTFLFIIVILWICFNNKSWKCDPLGSGWPCLPKYDVFLECCRRCGRLDRYRCSVCAPLVNLRLVGLPFRLSEILSIYC